MSNQQMLTTIVNMTLTSDTNITLQFGTRLGRFPYLCLFFIPVCVTFQPKWMSVSRIEASDTGRH